jgi:putative ABC transport system substrate-binding protein
MRRRDFIKFIAGGVAAWPLQTRAQRPAMPVVGYLRSGSRSGGSQNESGFRQGLSSLGFIEGRNVTIDYRYDENQNDRLPALAADLVRQQVTVIYAGNNGPAVAAKAATTTIPIVFRIGGDPIQLGLVASLNRPGGNMTGASFLQTMTVASRLQMLHETTPNAAIMGLMVNRTNPNAESNTREAQEAARKLGLELVVVNAGSAPEIDTAFATLIQRNAQALVIDGDNLFTDRRQHLATLTARHALPAIYPAREFPDAGGLMSYGTSIVDADRLGGVYVGRILRGDKPADLPVQQAVKVELVINMITAKVLGITFPLTLRGRADEVIE